MKTAFLPRLRPLFFLGPLFILVIILSDNAYAQETIRLFNLRQEPSNETTGGGVIKEANILWGCHLRSTGAPIPCNFFYQIDGLEQPEACVLNEEGGITSCNNGGHSHNGNRPLIFNENNGGELEYDADKDDSARRVEGVTTATGRFATVVHKLPPAAGVIAVKGELNAPRDFFFFRPRFSPKLIKVEGTVDVRILGLKQLRNPTAADFFRKVRGGPFGTGTDSVHIDGVAYAGSPATVALLPLIAENYFFLSLGRLLSINDISLPKGGLFEASFSNPQWVGPHFDHRDGNDVDINRRDPITGVLLGTCKGDRALRLGADQLLFPTKREDGTLSALFCESEERRHLDIKTTVVE